MNILKNYQLKMLDNMLVIDTFCELGEGPIWHEIRLSWCWFDIVEQLFFEVAHNDIDSSKPKIISLSEMASAMAVVNSKTLVLMTETSLEQFDLDTGKLVKICGLPIDDGFRTNDGGVGSDGNFWFSTMEKKPTGTHGSVYSITPDLKVTKQYENIAIPNTFCWLDEGRRLLLSDSFEQKTYSVPLVNGRLVESQKSVFLDLSDSNMTPDGGAVDENGNIWIALWGGYKVACYDPSGKQVHEIELPVPQPTSCCFGGPEGRHLLITSAKEGLSEKELEMYPLSGSVFCVELKVKGVDIPIFRMER